MSDTLLDGEKRECLDCHGWLVYNNEIQLWEHMSDGSDSVLGCNDDR